MMEYRQFEITIVSADDLPSIRHLKQVYAVVSLNGKTFKTEADKEGKAKPRWNASFREVIEEEPFVKKGGKFVVVKLYCKRSWPRGDKLIGDEVKIEVKSLFDRGEWSQNSVRYRVPEAGGATLNISYRFGQVLVPKPSALKTFLGFFMNCFAVASGVI